MILTFAGLEAAHIHLDPGVARESASCLICISAHATPPALTVFSLPTVMAVEMMFIPHTASGTGIAGRLELFTRPPPHAL